MRRPKKRRFNKIANTEPDLLHLIVDLGHHREVHCTVRFSNSDSNGPKVFEEEEEDFETSPDFFLMYVDMYVISTQKNPMKIHRCFRTRTDVTATMAASGLGSSHRPYLGGAQARRIGVIPTLWVTQPVLGLGEIHRVGER